MGRRRISSGGDKIMKTLLILTLLVSCSTQSISESCNNFNGYSSKKECIIAKEDKRNQLIEDVKRRRDNRQICTKSASGVNCN